MNKKTPLGERYKCAQFTTIALGGKWHGSYGTAPCPVCQPDGRHDQNALTLADGSNTLLAHCKKSNCSFADILTAAGALQGSFIPPYPAFSIQRRGKNSAQTKKRAKQAEQCWKESLSIAGTIAEAYLRNRGITCELPTTLRFHPDCWHGPTQTRHPAMIAKIEGGETCAVHRTFLRPDGSVKAGLNRGDKLMLGSARGCSVRLRDLTGPLVVAEGIETALSLSSGLLRAPAAIWAALSASGMRGLILPAHPGNLTIATDGDAAGREAGQALAKRAHALGWAVSLLSAPEGRDWNDILNTKGEAA